MEDPAGKQPAAVWLWEAPGPRSRASGVCGNQAAAMDRAESFLLAGASGARVEEARLVIGAHLVPSYRRTGRGGTACRAGGGVSWSPLTVRP